MASKERWSCLPLSFRLFMASMAAVAVWLVEPAKADGLTAAASQPGQQQAELTIRIEGISPGGGLLRLGLYDAAGYPDDDSPVATADVPATPGGVTVTLKDLKPGRYAIESFQDINGNGKMDTSWLGLPEEPYGFSRDAHPFLSKPGFSAVAFVVTAGANSQTLHLQNSRQAASAGF
ncbi:MAG TPA: DUF2141 domain-containing protein [Rhizomicrobium sp.]|nr:DUF2141 domain-containing protein [Rhizomicrobium sp.]HWC62548.1 DUF2141 domain-containing protein [Rhizomicrobium sp.]